MTGPVKLKSGLVLEEGEEVVFELKVSFWRHWWELLLLKRKHGYLVITNKRVAEVYNNYVCWCISTSRKIKFVLPKSVCEVGYQRAGCLCKSTFLYYQALTQKTAFEVDNEKTAVKLVEAFYKVINAAS